MGGIDPLAGRQARDDRSGFALTSSFRAVFDDVFWFSICMHEC